MGKTSRPVYRKKLNYTIASGTNSIKQGLTGINGVVKHISVIVPVLDAGDQAKVEISDIAGPILFDSSSMTGDTAYDNSTDVALGGNLQGQSYENIKISCDSNQTADRNFNIIFRLQTEG